ncbi:solute carrier family 22 member 5-like [Megalops cyprinoides]|uniref:solute carrier family 22 member 5-like n=1 Tax=Megalops cyprinoides TaxID=118141 RepID=UPI001863B957|nr:solute carrier family 22 member 5-like [Megalops cyprinoides]
MRDYDQDTAFLGQWGSFQRVVFFLLCTSTIPNGFSAFSVIFLGDSPPHWCLIPESANISAEWRRASIPTEVVNGEIEHSRCRRYRLDLIANFSARNLVPGQDVNLTDVQQEGCVDGWTYSNGTYQSTIVTEFDLVCSDQWKQPFTSSVYFLGVLCGSFFSGQLSDRIKLWLGCELHLVAYCSNKSPPCLKSQSCALCRFGRKPVLFMTMAVQTLFTFVQVFSPSWEVFSILFFIVGLGQISNYVAAFVLGTEILTGSVRVLYSSLGVCLFFAFGYMMLPFIAFFIRDWRTLLVALSVPGLAYIPLWWFIPESPRWLLTQGRVQEAEAILRDAARRNGVTPPEFVFTPTEGEERTCKRGESHSFLDLLRSRNIRHTTVILFLVWWTLSMGYFGLSLNTSHLHGNPYLNCFISAAIEVPAYVASWLALRYLPRRLCSSASMLLGGGVLFFIQLVPPSLPVLSISLEMIGKFGMATGTALMFVYTGELYPTVMRNTAVGACTMVSRVGSAIAPYFIHLGAYHKYLPYILLGSLTLLSAASTVFLPESFGRPLPETIAQMHKRERLKCTCLNGEQRNPPKEQVNSPVTLLESQL